MSMVDSLSSVSHIDTERMYVMGLSMGGMGTFELVSRMPKTFAAAAPICGGDNPKSAKKYAKKETPIAIYSTFSTKTSSGQSIPKIR